MNYEEPSPLEVASKRFFELINFNETQNAQAQFSEYCSEVVRLVTIYEDVPENLDLIWLIKDVIDDKSGFFVDWKDPVSFVCKIENICEHGHIEINLDWGLGETDEEYFFENIGIPELMELAYSQLQQAGFTLWNWNTNSNAYGGWITHSDDCDEMPSLAEQLGVEIRQANQAF